MSRSLLLSFLIALIIHSLFSQVQLDFFKRPVPGRKNLSKTLTIDVIGPRQVKKPPLARKTQKNTIETNKIRPKAEIKPKAYKEPNINIQERITEDEGTKENRVLSYNLKQNTPVTEKKDIPSDKDNKSVQKELNKPDDEAIYETAKHKDLPGLPPFAQTSYSLPIYLEKIFIERGPRLYGILMTVNALIVIFITLLLITALKKVNPIISISIAGLLFAVGFGMLYYSKIYILCIVSTFFWTLGEIINSVSSNVLVANYSPVTHRGRFNAIFYFINGIGFALGPLLAGLYIRYFGIRQVWPFVFFLSIFASLMMLFLFVIERKRKGKTRKKIS